VVRGTRAVTGRSLMRLGDCINRCRSTWRDEGYVKNLLIPSWTYR